MFVRLGTYTYDSTNQPTGITYARTGSVLAAFDDTCGANNELTATATSGITQPEIGGVVTGLAGLKAGDFPGLFWGYNGRGFAYSAGGEHDWNRGGWQFGQRTRIQSGGRRVIQAGIFFLALGVVGSLYGWTRLSVAKNPPQSHAAGANRARQWREPHPRCCACRSGCGARRGTACHRLGLAMRSAATAWGGLGPRRCPAN